MANKYSIQNINHTRILQCITTKSTLMSTLQLLFQLHKIQQIHQYLHLCTLCYQHQNKQHPHFSTGQAFLRYHDRYVTHKTIIKTIVMEISRDSITNKHDPCTLDVIVSSKCTITPENITMDIIGMLKYKMTP